MAEKIHSANADVTALNQLQQRISLATWIITLLMSLRGLYDFYGMKQKGFLEQVVAFFTEPMVQLFQFPFLKSLEDIPAIGVLFATVCLLLLSSIIQIVVKVALFKVSRTKPVFVKQTV